MPRIFDSLFPEDKPGRLTVESQSREYSAVFYCLSTERIDLWTISHGLEPQDGVLLRNPAKLLEVNGATHSLTMIPIKTRARDRNVLAAKYKTKFSELPFHTMPQLSWRLCQKPRNMSWNC